VGSGAGDVYTTVATTVLMLAGSSTSTAQARARDQGNGVTGTYLDSETK
jgi:hypothetical protein